MEGCKVDIFEKKRQTDTGIWIDKIRYLLHVRLSGYEER
jgi:hypothetical protein